MAIRKRSALLLGAIGFLTGIVFAQYQRKRLSKPLIMSDETAKLHTHQARPQVPMQTVDETIAAARQPRNKAGYTTH